MLVYMQGFLPVEWDPFFRDVLYPSFSPQMLLFLGMSSAYGLWKTGKYVVTSCVVAAHGVVAAHARHNLTSWFRYD